MALWSGEVAPRTETRLMFDISTIRSCGLAMRIASDRLTTPGHAQDGGADYDGKKPRQHERDGAGASRVCRKPAGRALGRHHRRGRVHRQDGEGPRATDEQGRDPPSSRSTRFWLASTSQRSATGAQGACRSCRLRIPASAYGRPASSRLTSLPRLATDDFRDARLGAFAPSDAGRPGQTLRRAAEAASRSKSCRILGMQICSAS
jgi:hypothetical protein